MPHPAAGASPSQAVMHEGTSWLDHPRIAAHYRQRGLIDGLTWQRWVVKQLGGPASRSLQLGCGTGDQSRALFEKGLSAWIDGIDADEALIACAESRQSTSGAPGIFRVADVNTADLPRATYDLVFACHSFRRFAAVERILDQVHASLTPRGFFVLEEFVGPSRFQWTDTQIALVRALIGMMPERFKRFRWGAVKEYEGRPSRADVAAVSPFESIRSGEIAPLVGERFHAVAERALGGTLQHLVYNGIVHNFAPDDEEGCRLIDQIAALEDTLIDIGSLPSDFTLMICRRR